MDAVVVRDPRRARRIRPAATLAAVVVSALVLTACGGGGDDASGPSSTRPRPTTTLTLTLGAVTVESAGPAATLPDDQARQVLAALDAFLWAATVEPLRGQGSADAMAASFAGPAGARAVGPDRTVVADEGLPKVVGSLTFTAEPVTLVALADEGGSIVVVTAALNLRIVGDVGTADDLTITRTGQLVLERDGAGAWKITGYDLAVERSGAGLDPTTTTAPTSRSGR